MPPVTVVAQDGARRRVGRIMGTVGPTTVRLVTRLHGRAVRAPETHPRGLARTAAGESGGVGGGDPPAAPLVMAPIAAEHQKLVRPPVARRDPVTPVITVAKVATEMAWTVGPARARRRRRPRPRREPAARRRVSRHRKTPRPVREVLADASRQVREKEGARGQVRLEAGARPAEAGPARP